MTLTSQPRYADWMRYRLRTLLILLAVLPPVLAVGWWGYAQVKAGQQRRAKLELLIQQEQERLAVAREVMDANPGLSDAEFNAARAEVHAIVECLKVLESAAGRR